MKPLQSGPFRVFGKGQKIYQKWGTSVLVHTDSTGQSALKSSELLENGLLSFEK